MDGAYWIAWIILYLFGCGLIALCVYPLRRWFYVAFIVGSMGVLWMLVPIPLGEGHWAPLFVTLIFQLFFDPEANYTFAAAVATVGSTAIIAATLLLYVCNTVFRRIEAFKKRNGRLTQHDDASPAAESGLHEA